MDDLEYISLCTNDFALMIAVVEHITLMLIDM